MIYFATHKKLTWEHENITHHHAPDHALDIILNNPYEFGGYKFLGIDTETTGFDPYKDEVILTAISNGEDTLVVDNREFNLKQYIKYPQNYVWIGHNIKFDCAMLDVNFDLQLNRSWCTMCVDQRIFQGMHRRQYENGRDFDLVSTIKYYLKFIPRYMKKEVRTEFYKDVTIEPRHVLYVADDTRYLPKLMKAQYAVAKKTRQLKYVLTTQSWLHMAVASMENLGFELDEEMWLGNVPKFKEEAFQIECALDKEMRRLRDTLLTKEEVLALKGKEYDCSRTREIVQIGLFGEPVSNADLNAGVRGVTRKQKYGENYINWSSTSKILEIFAKLKLPLPVEGSYETDSAIPRLIPIRKSGKLKYQIDKSRYTFTTRNDVLQEYLVENPDHKGKDLLELILKYRQVQKNISTYGEMFVHKTVNPVSGRIHSLYRIESAITGRFQSGGGKLQPDRYNAQNIPRDVIFRHCMKGGKGYNIFTGDLSSAEALIMCDKAYDTVMYEAALEQDDAHGVLGTACWREVFLYRAGIMAGIWSNSEEFNFRSTHATIKLLEGMRSQHGEIDYYMEQYNNYTISRKLNKDARTQFKAITFGIPYGAYASKVAKVLSINKDEAEVVINAYRKKVPKVMEYMDNNAEFAITNGFIRINDRTNARILFPLIRRAKKLGEELKFKDKTDIQNKARNAPIQGTQADMLKEAIAEIHRYALLNEIKSGMIAQVHDEIVARVPFCMDGVSDEWLQNPTHLKGYFDYAWEYATFEKIFKQQLEGDHVLDVIYDGPNVAGVEGSYPLILKLHMVNTAKRYLKHYYMNADFDIKDSWTK